MEHSTFSYQFIEDLKKQLEQSGEKYLVSTNEVQKMNQTYEAITVNPENGLVGVNLKSDKCIARHNDSPAKTKASWMGKIEILEITQEE